MSFSIAFVGVDGAGKTTLINKTATILDWFVVSHQNGFMKRFYHHQRSKTWEWFNLLECKIRNWYWKRQLWTNTSLLMDRCYMCALVYSNLEGVPRIAHKLKKSAVKPDVIVLMEPVEELVPNAYRFTREYKRMLKEEGYVYFKRGFHLFGRITFWKQPETAVTPILDCYLNVIGSP